MTGPKSPKVRIGEKDIQRLLTPFGVNVLEKGRAQILDYIALLEKWNQSLSLTTVVRPEEIVTRHFGESMYLASLLPVENCRLADLGSGPGFPALPLVILNANIQATLIESNKKKCAFLSEVVRTLALPDVTVIPSRFEDVKESTTDIVTVRALGGFSKILRWARNSLADRGHIALWVGGEDTTKISSTPGWTWQPAIRIPESQRRFILIGRPLRDL